MRNRLTFPWILCLVIVASCVDDDDRCGKYQWDPSTNSCLVVETISTDTQIADTGTGSSQDTGTESSSDSDSGTTPVMNMPCDVDADCLQYNTDYCLIVQSDPGVCTLKNCVDTPDICPTGYICCDSLMTALFLDHCMANDVYAELGAALCR